MNLLSGVYRALRSDFLLQVLTRIQRYGAASLDVLPTADFQMLVAANFFFLVADDLQRHGSIDLGVVMTRAAVARFDDLVFFALNLLELLFLDDQVPFFTDPFSCIFLDPDILIPLGVNKQLFRVFLVFQTNLVETGPTLARIAFERGHGGVVRQGIGRHVDAVVDPTGDDRLVGIAFQKIDDHFLADARDAHRPPFFTSPVLRDPNPAGTVFIRCAVAIPGELAFDPAVFIGPDFFVGLAHHNRGLWPLH